jgi:hypothetical protein
MLVHERHMTLAMERHHECPVDVHVVDRKWDGDVYGRKSILTKQGTDVPVQLGFVRFHFEYVTDAVKDEIISETIPMGRVLINHNVLRHIDLGAIVKFTAGPGLADYLQMVEGGETYGRLATIFCNKRPAVDLLEISAPLKTELS